jgi:hypothetical protein
MTSPAPPPPGDAAGGRAGAAGRSDHALAARLAATDAARLAAEARALVAEARVRELEAQLAALTAAPAEPAAIAGGVQPDEESLSLFDDVRPLERPGRSADGSDATVLPVALIGVAVVAGMATLLALVNGRMGFGIVMLGATGLLLWLAHATWVTPVEVSVEDGVVHIDHGTTKHRFDLRNARTQVEMSGDPGDRDWQVRFLRRGRDPFVVRDGMVDAHAFVRRLREWRPDL